ncbi:phenylalanine--tRNA ligase subunit beta [Patescibacteria group bacterium]|nr:phenylalanine--tRNA ligase subunit beta [Patescibacteria group bacterium]
MQISLSWLKQFVNIPTDLNPEELGNLITLHTAEIEKVEDLSKQYTNMVIAKVVELKKHPDADKLQIATVDDGTEKHQVVCGGANLINNIPVILIKPGGLCRWHGEGDLIEVKNAKIRGIESSGMICAAEEIGLKDVFPHGPQDIVNLNDYDTSEIKIGQPLSDFMGTDIVFEVDNKSLTHRPDLWGHYGLAREIATILKKNLKPLSEFINDAKITDSDKNLPINIEDPDLCPRYCGAVIKGVKIAPSPDWLRQKVEAVGYRAINNIVDITNYVMAELGQPMHAFDRNFIKGGITVRRAKKGETITTLDDQERKLTTEDLLIADDEKAVALAGVMGGLNSEIREETTEIILESANFNPITVRKTSVHLGLRTESVQRFEKSLDPNLAETAIRRAIKLILEICPDAKLETKIIDCNHFKNPEIEIEIPIKRIISKIGKKIETEEMVDILTRLEFEVEENKDSLKVKVPSFRATKDIDIEADIIEEIARMHGYENIEPILPQLAIKLPHENPERKRKHEARAILSYGLGMDEIYKYSFNGLEDITKCLLDPKNHVELENYLSAEQTHLRSSLVPNIMNAITDNLKNFDELKIYEIGHTYLNRENDLPIEEKYICGAVVLPKKSKEEPFYYAKGILEEFMKKFHTGKLMLNAPSDNLPPYTHPKKTAIINVNGTNLGHLFTINPIVSNNFEIHNPIAFFEINFTKLIAIKPQVYQYKPIPKFPASDLDISVIVEEKTQNADIKKTIRGVDKKIIQDIKLFDTFRDEEKLGPGKKALAYKVKLQAPDRTLEDKEVEKTLKEIISALQKTGGEVRGG